MKDVIVYTDFELIDKLIEDGNNKWFGILYDRYSSKVYNKCLLLIRDKDAAMDVTHDIFIKAFIHMSQFKRGSSFYTWLYKIVYNTCLDYLKKSNQFRTISVKNDLVMDIPDEIEDEELLAIESERLKVLLEKIPTDDKLILMMKYQDKMKIQDICQVLNIGNSAAKMKINRAKKKIIGLYNNTYRHSIHYLNK